MMPKLRDWWWNALDVLKFGLVVGAHIALICLPGAVLAGLILVALRLAGG